MKLTVDLHTSNVHCIACHPTAHEGTWVESQREGEEEGQEDGEKDQESRIDSEPHSIVGERLLLVEESEEHDSFSTSADQHSCKRSKL